MEEEESDYINPPKAENGLYDLQSVKYTEAAHDKSVRMIMHNLEKPEVVAGEVAGEDYDMILQQINWAQGRVRDREKVRELLAGIGAWGLTGESWDERLVGLRGKGRPTWIAVTKAGARAGGLECIVKCFLQQHNIAPGGRSGKVKLGAKNWKEGFNEARVLLGQQDLEVRKLVGSLVLGWEGTLGELVHAARESLNLGKVEMEEPTPVPTAQSGKPLGLGF